MAIVRVMQMVLMVSLLQMATTFELRCLKSVVSGMAKSMAYEYTNIMAYDCPTSSNSSEYSITTILIVLFVYLYWPYALRG